MNRAQHPTSLQKRALRIIRQVKVTSHISQLDAVEVLTRSLGFRIVKEKDLQTEMRKCKITSL